MQYGFYAPTMDEHRETDGPYDMVRFGKTSDPGDTRTVEASAEAGATWWLDSIYTWETTLDATRERLHLGPPRI